jgi:DNA repair ATPase RecN
VYSSNHIHVVKKVENNKTKSTIMILNEIEKIEEIARMLGSSKKSKESATNHANEMFNNIKDLITKGE